MMGLNIFDIAHFAPETVVGNRGRGFKGGFIVLHVFLWSKFEIPTASSLIDMGNVRFILVFVAMFVHIVDHGLLGKAEDLVVNLLFILMQDNLVFNHTSGR